MTGFVLFFVMLAVFVDVFVQAWGMVQVGAEVLLLRHPTD
jgi:hypothetical protein